MLPAAVIYSTNGTGAPGYDSTSFWLTVNNIPPPESFWLTEAMRFTVPIGGSGVLSQLTVAASETGPSLFSEIFYIVNDNSGSPGREILDTITVGAPSAESSPQLVSGASTLNPFLLGGQSYFLETSIPPGYYDEFRWFLASPSIAGTLYQNSTGQWTSVCCGTSSFALQGTPAPTAPEPASIALLGLGLLAIPAYRLWRPGRRGLRDNVRSGKV